MRSILDVVRDAGTLLSRSELEPLFARADQLARLALRLLHLTRQGIPATPDPPSFAGECTPPLAECYAPFHPALATWHDHPDSPAVTELIARAFDVSSIPQVLALLGMRQTPGSVLDLSALPASHSELLAAADRPYSPMDRLSVAGRALDKHFSRPGEKFWPTSSGSPEEKSLLARGLIERFLEEQSWWNVFIHFKHARVYEVRIPTGQGARWEHQGDFIGFIEPFEAECLLPVATSQQ